MESRFTSEFFAGNRRKLKKLFTGKAPVVVGANGLLQRSADNPYSFAQDASFWYLTGIDDPDIVLVMDKDKEYLIVPERDVLHEAFNGKIITEALTARSGIEVVLGDKDGWQQLGVRLKKVRHIATIAAPPAYSQFYGMYTNPARAALIKRLKEHNQSAELLDISEHLARQRLVKQPEELAAIKAAIEITIAGMQAAFRPAKLAGYGFEYQLEAELTRNFRRRGAPGHAFDPIVAGGSRACTIHNLANKAALQPNELIVVDVGAEVEHYAADITRTISLRPPSKRQQAVHMAVVDVQSFAMSLLKPGADLKDYEAGVEHYMGEKLRELGLLRTIDHDSVRRYYPHVTSHYLGLNVHDVGDRQEVLPLGAVLTVEPGIYIPEEGIGVRVEDDVLVTKNGIKVLTKKLRKDLH